MTKKIDKAVGGTAGDESAGERLAALERAVDDRNGELTELKEDLARQESVAAEYLETLQRVRAESENYRKRLEREHAQVIEFANQSIICALLPLIDNLERAIESTRDARDFDRLADGVHIIFEQLKATLAESGLEVVEPVGEEFDPQLHEAVLQVESDEHEENTVVEVMQKGYCLKGRVIRPAMVKVSRGS